MISISTASQLLDFGVRIGQGKRADEQLEGAVALHNILCRHRVAYLADEVGMGKTYVALAASWTNHSVNFFLATRSRPTVRRAKPWITSCFPIRRSSRQRMRNNGM